MNGVNVGVNVQSNAQTTSSSQTTTTTTTTTTTNSQEHHTTPHHSLPNRPPDVSSSPSCFMAIGEFNQAKESISKKSFSDSKMILAKQMTESHCFTSLQIKEITALLILKQIAFLMLLLPTIIVLINKTTMSSTMHFNLKAPLMS